MLTLYTAVGTLKFQKTTGGKSIPLVINDGQEYGLSDDELLLWSCLAFQILTLHELQDAYTLRQIQKEGPKGLSFQHYLNRLSLRGLVVSGIGLTGGYIREPRYQKERSPTGSFVKSGFRHIEFSIRSGNRASFPNRKHIAGWQISSV